MRFYADGDHSSQHVRGWNIGGRVSVWRNDQESPKGPRGGWRKPREVDMVRLVLTGGSNSATVPSVAIHADSDGGCTVTAGLGVKVECIEYSRYAVWAGPRLGPTSIQQICWTLADAMYHADQIDPAQHVVIEWTYLHSTGMETRTWVRNRSEQTLNGKLYAPGDWIAL